MSKLERLLNLTAALLAAERPLTADQIRSRVEGYPENLVAFRRAFERDKDDLREMGIPLRREAASDLESSADGYRIDRDDYYLRDPGLDPDELAALHLAARVVRVGGRGATSALWKLGGQLGPAGEPTGAELVVIPTDVNLTPAFQAVAERRVVRFAYSGRDREVEPHRLELVRGRWYLSGHDRSRDDDRHFRLDRVDGPLDLGEPGGFDPPTSPGEGVRLEPWQLGDREPTTARLLVDTAQVPWARHELGAPVELREDGSAVFEVPVTDDVAFRGFVLAFLEHAEVLEPIELRHSIVEWLQQVARR
ncbi:MAG: WYL domain-containing protein [Acidimicrobiales bacterium]|nr:WYL domain-containing protein [Acidimicrobiales bacterium]